MLKKSTFLHEMHRKAYS